VLQCILTGLVLAALILSPKEQRKVNLCGVVVVVIVAVVAAVAVAVNLTSLPFSDKPCNAFAS